MDKFEKIRAALQAGELDKARKMVRWLLKNEPSAEAWYLAAQVVEAKDEKIKCLRQAITLDTWHKAANLELYKIEGSTPTEIVQRQTEWTRKAGEKPVTEIKRQLKQDRFQQQAQRHRVYTRMGCVCSIFFSIFFSLSVFRAAGLMSAGLSRALAQLFNQPKPVDAINNTPIAMISKPQLILTPSQVKAASPQGVEVLDAGYVHEHNFIGVPGVEYAVYVQFISATAKHVTRNVTIVDPNNGEAGQRCPVEHVLQDDTNVSFVCNVDVPGKWRILIMGRDQESVGAYFVGVRKLD